MLIPADTAVELLMRGEVVAVPTETVYGLAAIATRPDAIAKVYEIKNRPADNPLICHFHSIEQIRKYVSCIPPNTQLLLNHFSPGPVSFMLDLPADSPLRFATCGSMQVIARIPDHPLFLGIIKKCDAPVAAPSANTSGRVSPTSAAMVAEDIGDKIAGIVDGGPSKIGLESTILDARKDNSILILRRGSIAESEMNEVLHNTSAVIRNEHAAGTIPGMKYRHYAPKTPVYIARHIDEVLSSAHCALLLTDESLQSIPRHLLRALTILDIHLVNLGSIQAPEKIATGFYRLLSSVDSLKVEKAFILETDWGESSVGKALHSRISKIVAN